MMYSDYFALSSTAISLIYVPFLIICQLRFAHILQYNGYSNSGYFSWIRSNFGRVLIPLAGICLYSFAAEMMLRTYLENTALHEMDVIVTYFIAVLSILAVMALLFQRYTKLIKIETNELPLSCSNKLISITLIGSMFVCVLAVLQGLFSDLLILVYFLPLCAPFFVPIANRMVQKKKQMQDE